MVFIWSKLMGFYFNTSNQKNGDSEYNNQNYKAALKWYKKGLAQLDTKAENNKVREDMNFIDAYAFVCGEIIVTSIMASTDSSYESAIGLLRQILSYRSMMEYYVEKLDSEIDYNTNAEHLNNVYDKIGGLYELISDHLADKIDTIPQNSAPAEKLKLLNAAIEMMFEAQQSYNSIGSKLKSYLGLLGLYEKMYELEPNQQTLIAMNDWLSNPPIDLAKVDKLNRLEWYAHKLSVAIKLNQANCHAIADKCREVMEEFTEAEHAELWLLYEVKQNLAKLPARLDVDLEYSRSDESDMGGTLISDPKRYDKHVLNTPVNNINSFFSVRTDGTPSFNLDNPFGIK